MMPRSHHLDIFKDPRFSLRDHGKWVIVQRFNTKTIGRIAYFDKTTNLYWVVFDDPNAAGSYLRGQMKLMPLTPVPWYQKKRKKTKKIGLTTEIPLRNIRKTHSPRVGDVTGGETVARRSAEVDEIEDDEFEDLSEEEETTPKRKSSKKAASSSRAKAEPAKGIGARQIAERLGCEPKTFRSWLRRQVAEGNVDLNGDREGKERYNFGESWNNPLIQEVMELWKSSNHEKGAGLKKAQEVLAAKKAGKSATAKKSVKKVAKKAVKRSR